MNHDNIYSFDLLTFFFDEIKKNQGIAISGEFLLGIN